MLLMAKHNKLSTEGGHSNIGSVKGHHNDSCVVF